MLPNLRRKRGSLLGTFALLTGCALALFVALWMVDYATSALPRSRADRGPVSLLFAFDTVTLQAALGNLASIIAAVLGLAITVVSIVVQLAATRYTPRVVDMFFRDRTNQGVMGFFVVACVVALWVSFVVTAEYTPFATVIVTIVIATSSILILLPYFVYVFDFIEPEKVIDRLGEQTLAGVLGGSRDGRPTTEVSTAARQTATVTSMEQLADIAINALSQKDKVIATDAISALRRVVVDYLPRKATLDERWFAIGPGLVAHPDFVAMAKDSLAELAAQRSWLEWKGLRHLREVFSEALNAMPEMAHVVAIETRYVGEAALVSGDAAVLNMTLKFMNTYLRAALNAGDVRSAYNLLNQYRQLAESMLRATPAASTDAVVEVGSFFKYYAQLAQRMGLGFVTETAAYDLCALCEVASELQAGSHERLLATVLEIDKQAETDADEKALRGVRKAQAKLAAYYLTAANEAHARLIHRDMANESPERLRSIRDEMLAITSKEFWEVIDRGTNFDYLDERRKQKLREFFAWFGELKGAVA